MATPIGPPTTMTRRRLRIRGTVQGVGFRPFVHRTATTLGLRGSVVNTGDGVTIEVWGEPAELDELERRLRVDAPPLARIGSIELEQPGGPDDERSTATPTDFRILDSPRPDRPPRAELPADVAMCEACRQELLDPTDRRYGHPFITCTDCGPRFTITRTLPYDRGTTTMSGFEMCTICAAEYHDPTDRRFHAQPIGCHDCGPHLVLTERSGRLIAERGDAIAEARRAIDSGLIVAVQGTGGHHLVCDATRTDAVAGLRERKRRPDKPFAVMVRSLAALDELADAGGVVLSGAERAALTSARRPIVLLRRPAARATPPAWMTAVAPGCADLGVMLPDTPVHHLLFDGLATDVVVCTSGNPSDDPVITDPADARHRLGHLADLFLQHDRPIHRHCDDSIVRILPDADGESCDRVVLVRRARGWTPEPIPLDGRPGRPVLAMGGDLKGAVCVSDGARAWMSQHLGDLGTLESYRAAHIACEQLIELAGVAPGAIAVDAHPSYLSRRLGHELAARWSLPVVEVQHHHAHLASVIADAIAQGRRPPDAVLGIICDGTGYGSDGTIWGGELLLAESSPEPAISTGRMPRRVGHLRAVPLPGGDAIVGHPARTALAHLRAADLEWDEHLPAVQAVDIADRRALAAILRPGSPLAVASSSTGRLFDAVASLIGLCHEATYEAHAAIALEHAADPDAPGGYRFGPAAADGSIDPAPVLRRIVDDVLAGTPAGTISMRFHRAVIAMLVDEALRCWATDPALDDPPVIALSGGMFQNRIIAEGCAAALRARGAEVLTHALVPCNDGGLALGQAIVAGGR